MTPEQWEGYQACIKDVLSKRVVNRDGKQIGFLAKVGPNSVGEYIAVAFEDENPPPAQPAVCIGISTEQIVSWAKEAGMTIDAPSWGYSEVYHFKGYENPLKRFVSLALAAHGIITAPTQRETK
jgi:hypothetical protein